MPKVSPEHLAGRRRQILDAALSCFAEKGFHVTSMQDIFTRSDLSPGAVYRYFRGKDEIIEAIASETFPHIHGAVEQAVHAQPPPGLEDVVADVFAAIQRIADLDLRLRTAVQVWAEALHNPTVGRMVTGFLTRMHEDLASVVRRAQAEGRADAALDPSATARALLSLFAGFVLQSNLFPDMDRAAYRDAARALVGGQLNLRPEETAGSR